MSLVGSWVLGTLPLWVVLAAAARTARRRPLPPPRRGGPPGLVGAGVAALAVQATHALEETVFGFPRAYPLLLGLTPWSTASFVAFNAVWLVLWAAVLATLARGRNALAWPLWFLAFALALNGVAHPALSLAVGGYFPGLVTSPVAGVAGVVLGVRLARA